MNPVRIVSHSLLPATFSKSTRILLSRPSAWLHHGFTDRFPHRSRFQVPSHHSLLQCRQCKSSASQSRILLIAAIVRSNVHREPNHKRRDCNHCPSRCYNSSIFDPVVRNNGQNWGQGDSWALQIEKRWLSLGLIACSRRIFFFSVRWLLKADIIILSRRVAVNWRDAEDEIDEDEADKYKADGANEIYRARKW